MAKLTGAAGKGEGRKRGKGDREKREGERHESKDGGKDRETGEEEIGGRME